LFDQATERQRLRSSARSAKQPSERSWRSRRLQPRLSGAVSAKIQCACRTKRLSNFIAAVTRPIRGHIILPQLSMGASEPHYSNPVR